MDILVRLLKTVTAVVLMVALCGPLYAAQQKKVVLQLTDNSTEKQVLVLNVASNLLREYGDNIQLEVVAFGPGLNLLYADNTNSDRVTTLAENGVRFSACQNTLSKVNKLLDREKEINKYAKQVSGGASRSSS